MIQLILTNFKHAWVLESKVISIGGIKEGITDKTVSVERGLTAQEASERLVSLLKAFGKKEESNGD